MTGEAAEEKRGKLTGDIAAALGRVKGGEVLEEGTRKALAEKIVEVACTITPPPDEEPAMTEFLVMGRGGFGGGASSTKPGNVLFKPTRLAALTAKTITSAVGIEAHPWFVGVAALLLWDELWSRLKIEIQEREANVAWTLWVHKDTERLVPKAGLLGLVNAERADYGRAPILQAELDDALGILLKMGCIETARKNPDVWFVREWISAPFR